ncbi:ABC transporter ATP-binding protein [Streptomyces collinus]|uniref:ABC transporter ATP-binding protein n=1 Tax=Streptomyces collinus TaxID=42684 RepID=UPI0036B95909
MHTQNAPAVATQGLRERFQDSHALCGVDLQASPGEVLGLLGPNGAGKTTLVKILTTLLKLDSGQVIVNGWNVTAEPEKARFTIGMAGRYSTVDGTLTGFENLCLLAKPRGVGRRTARRTAYDLLSRFRLCAIKGRPASTCSGGMRRRLDLAAALVGSPPLVVLDGPSTALDPESRLDTWDAVGELVASDSTALALRNLLQGCSVLVIAVFITLPAWRYRTRTGR